MTADLPADTRRKLVGVLGLLGSDHAGERDAAARLATRLVRGAGLTWSDLIAVAEPPPYRPPPFRPTDWPVHWRVTAERCAAFPEWLSQWEREFLSGLSYRLRISAKQFAALESIASYLRRRGVDV